MKVFMKAMDTLNYTITRYDYRISICANMNDNKKNTTFCGNTPCCYQWYMDKFCNYTLIMFLFSRERWRETIPISNSILKHITAVHFLVHE